MESNIRLSLFEDPQNWTPNSYAPKYVLQAKVGDGESSGLIDLSDMIPKDLKDRWTKQVNTRDPESSLGKFKFTDTLLIRKVGHKWLPSKFDHFEDGPIEMIPTPATWNAEGRPAKDENPPTKEITFDGQMIIFYYAGWTTNHLEKEEFSFARDIDLPDGALSRTRISKVIDNMCNLLKIGSESAQKEAKSKNQGESKSYNSTEFRKDVMELLRHGHGGVL
jgi:hypothetical protein